MAEEEFEVSQSNQFKTARNEFRKKRLELDEDEIEDSDESDENGIEEDEDDGPRLKNRPRKPRIIDNTEEDEEEEEDEEQEVAPKPKRKRRRKRAQKAKIDPLQPLKQIVSDERLHRVLGLALIFSSAGLLGAFTSFLFTWQADQDKVLGPWWELFFAADDVTTASGAYQVDNWLGKVGAVTSHLFIHKGFGVASFLFVVYAFLAGVRLAFKMSLIPLKKFFRRSLFLLCWSSVALGYIFYNKYFFLGGTFGFQSAQWLNGSLGAIGTGFFMVFSFFAFMVFSYDYSFDWLKSNQTEPQLATLDTMEKEEVLPAEELPVEVLNVTPTAEPESEVVQTEEPVVDSEPEPTPEEEIPAVFPEPEPATEVEENPVTIEMDAESPEEPEQENPEEEDVNFTVSKSTDEAVVDEDEEDLSSFGDFDPTLELSEYQRPSIDLLKDYGTAETTVNQEELVANKDRIISTLKNFGIEISKIKATIGPTVTLYEIIPAKGVRISKIKNLEDDIALSLAALGIRIIAPMPGKGTIGIEVPNQNPELVSMRSIIASEKFQNTTFELPFGLGKTIANETFIADLTKMPHLLVAGTTGQGKSVGLNAILTSLLYKKHPAQVKFVLIDPKRVELTLFNRIERHFLAKLPNSEDAIITDTTKVIHTLKSLCIEMDDRLNLFNMAMVRNVKEYNTKFVDRKLNPKKGHKYLPYIVVVVDEFGDLIAQAGKEIETPLTRLAAVARATGIHLIIATQRPSVNVVTGLIKANFPARIAFRVQAKIDSRTILDAGGADQLIGKGDMLFSLGSQLIRLQCPFVDTPEVENVTDFIGQQRGYPEAFQLPEYVEEDSDDVGSLDDEERDACFEDAARLVVTHQQGSASLLQRKLKLGYNRAGRIVDQLEAARIIGPFKGSKAREVLIKDPANLEQLLSSLSGGQGEDAPM